MTSEWHKTATAIQDQQQDGQTCTINDSSHYTSQGISRLEQSQEKVKNKTSATGFIGNETLSKTCAIKIRSHGAFKYLQCAERKE